MWAPGPGLGSYPSSAMIHGIALSKLFINFFSGPQFSHLRNGGNNIYFIRFRWGLIKWICVKWFKYCQPHNRQPALVSIGKTKRRGAWLHGCSECSLHRIFAHPSSTSSSAWVVPDQEERGLGNFLAHKSRGPIRGTGQDKILISNIGYRGNLTLFKF